VFNQQRKPDSSTRQLTIAISCCCDADTLNSIHALRGLYFEHVIGQLLYLPLPAADDALLLFGGLQLARRELHDSLAVQLVQRGRVGRLVAWVMNEVTAGAAIELLCSLVDLQPGFWRVALQAQPALLAGVCALAHDVAERASAFVLLRVLCHHELIEMDAENQDQLRAAVRAVPSALAAAAHDRANPPGAGDSATAAGGATKVRWAPGMAPNLSDAGSLAWTSLAFLWHLRRAAPWLVDANGAALRAVAASLSAHQEKPITDIAYEMLWFVLEANALRVHEVEAALLGLCRDVAQHRAEGAASLILSTILKLPGGPRLLARDIVIAAMLDCVRSDVEQQIGDRVTSVVINLLCELQTSDQAELVHAMLMRCGVMELLAMMGEMRRQAPWEESPEREELFKKRFLRLQHEMSRVADLL
jgi:hypothetical protein